jgi:hypothetical protein
MRSIPWLLVFVSSTCWPACNANMKDVIRDVMIYTGGDYIYFGLENQPSTPLHVSQTIFVISETVPAERRSMVLSRLLTAYASKENVNIGYDAQGDCVHGYIRVHRVG